MKYEIGNVVSAQDVHKETTFIFKIDKIKVSNGVQLLYGKLCSTGKDVYAVHQSLCSLTKPVGYTPAPKAVDSVENKPIKSDGKHSGYYDIKLSNKTLDFLSNNGFIKAEHLIYDLFGNDFDYGTVFKSLIRSWRCIQGYGKAGNTLDYELNKVEYYTDRIRENRSSE